MAQIAISVIVIWRCTGYNALIYLAGMQSISSDLYEAAALDSPLHVRHWTRERPRETADGHGGSAATPWIACGDIEFPRRPGPTTAMGWGIDPRGMTELLLRAARERPDLDVMVTENGAAFPDAVGADGVVHDDDRVEYLRGHLAAVHAAVVAGARVTGYCVWSLLDNFEWTWGYGKRFGIVHVDYATLARTPKDSARFYAQVVRDNAVPAVPRGATGTRRARTGAGASRARSAGR